MLKIWPLLETLAIQNSCLIKHDQPMRKAARQQSSGKSDVHPLDCGAIVG